MAFYAWDVIPVDNEVGVNPIAGQVRILPTPQKQNN